jgi:hypothetical protein
MSGRTCDAAGPGALQARAERLAARLYPHRVTLVTSGLGGFLLGALPLAIVALGRAELAEWHVGAFAASVPVVLWALCLAVLASFFHPTLGWIRVLDRAWSPRLPWLSSALRGYAALTVGAFAIAPIAVLVVAAV